MARTNRSTAFDHYQAIEDALAQAKGICGLVEACDSMNSADAVPADADWRAMQAARNLIEKAETSVEAVWRAYHPKPPQAGEAI